MIRAALISLSLLFASPALAAPEADGHSHAEPDFVLAEAPDDHVLGSADAPHTLILYASNVCPHCGEWFEKEWPTVKSRLVETGKLRLVFRPMVSQPAQLSEIGFTIAECSPEAKYMDVIEDQFARQTAILDGFRSQSREIIQTNYDAIGQTGGLTPEQIAQCLATGEHRPTLQRAMERGSAAGIRGIPAFIFDGQVMNGAHDAGAIMGWVEGRSSAR